MQGYEEEDGKYCYVTQTKDGRYLKSSTIYIKDSQEKIIGSLCINCDITEAMIAQSFVNQYIGIDNGKNIEATVYNNVDDLLIALISESIQYVGVPVAHMSREQKIKGIKYLEQKGALKIKNASTIIAKYYDVSKYTVYNYIDDSHNVVKDSG